MTEENNFWRYGRQIHRGGAALILSFLLLHLTNHLVALGGVNKHVELMASLRLIYRNAFVEPVFIAALVSQIASGVYRVITTWRDRAGLVGWLQAISGLYIALFLMIHISAVMFGRIMGTDTNFFFAAAGLHMPGLPWFFAPYYTLAVWAAFTHPACALHWALSRRGHSGAANAALIAISCAGLALGLLIVATLAGFVVPVVFPPGYGVTN